MTSKLKTMLKRQFSYPVRSNKRNEGSLNITQELKNISKDISQSENCVPIKIREKTEDASILSQKQRRHRSSLGPIEDILLCSICTNKLQSPRMMPCQHTFCLQCLKIQLTNSDDQSSLTCPLCELTISNCIPNELPTNLYIDTLLKVVQDSKTNDGVVKNTVTFAPLPGSSRDNNDTINLSTKCHTCEETCDKDNRCRHCRHAFCNGCWPEHTADLKKQLETLSEQLNSTANRFDHKIEDFRIKLEEIKESIDKDFESRMAELKQEREEKMKRANEMGINGETSADEIKQRVFKTREEMQEQKEGTYDCLKNHQEKVKTFLDLQRKAIELIEAISVWEPEVDEVEMGLNDCKESLEALAMKGNSSLLYRRKIFHPKVIVNRDIVQRPSGIAHDSWRDQTIVSCSGSGQVVILSRKYKLLKRIHHPDMLAPQGVAFFEASEEIFVTDKWKHCVFVFNRKGEFLRRICIKGQGKGQLRSPEGIAVNPKSNLIYVADTGNDRIQILQKDGTYVDSIGPTDKHATSVTRTGKIVYVIVNQLNQPTDVAVSPSDAVVVADCGNHKIKIFDQRGQILQTLGGVGSSRGFFRTPEVVRVDKKGNIIVGDSGNGRVQIFSSDGELLRVIGGKGSKKQFGWVSGVCVKGNYDILIADSKTNAIQLF